MRGISRVQARNLILFLFATVVALSQCEAPRRDEKGLLPVKKLEMFLPAPEVPDYIQRFKDHCVEDRQKCEGILKLYSRGLERR